MVAHGEKTDLDTESSSKTVSDSVEPVTLFIVLVVNSYRFRRNKEGGIIRKVHQKTEMNQGGEEGIFECGQAVSGSKMALE